MSYFSNPIYAAVHAIPGPLKSWETKLKDIHTKSNVSPTDLGWTGKTFLHTAVTEAGKTGSNVIPVVDFYLKHGVDINAQDGRGDTALHDAVRNRTLGVFRDLLRRGADATIKNKAGRTALDDVTDKKTRDAFMKVFRQYGQQPARGLAEVSALATAPPLREGGPRRQLPQDVVQIIASDLGLKERQTAKGRRKVRRRKTRRA